MMVGIAQLESVFEERTRLLAEDKETFHRLVDETFGSSLRSD